MSYIENARKLKAEIDANRETVNTLEAAGGIRTVCVQSDRIGFDWEKYLVNDVLVRTDYVEQGKPWRGSEDNPFEWTAQMPLIPNGYYTYEGVRKVWTGESGVTAEWANENFVEF